MIRCHFSKSLALALASSLALSTAASAEAADIGFARAEQIALGQVKGTVQKIARKQKHGQQRFEVEVRTAEGKRFDVLLEASDGHVVQVKQDD